MNPRSLLKLLSGLLMCVFILPCGVAAREVGGVMFRTLGYEFSLPQVSVTGLWQDEKGVIWLATKEGIKRYNGNRIETLPLSDLSNWTQNNFFPTITGDNDGHIWFTAGYDLVEYDLRTARYKVIFNQQFTDASPRIAFCRGRDKLWIGCTDSLFCYDGSGVHFVDLIGRSGNSTRGVMSLCEASDGTLWIGTRSHGLFRRLANGSIRKVVDCRSDINYIFEDSRGCIWAGTASLGAVQVDPDREIIWYNETAAEASRRLSGNLVRGIDEDDQGRIWLGTLKGIDLFEPGLGVTGRFGIGPEDNFGLQHPSVLCVMKDNQGTMWFGTYYGGLSYYNPNVLTFDYRDVARQLGKSEQPLLGKAVADKRGKLWMSSEHYGLLHQDPTEGVWKQFTSSGQLLPFRNVKTLLYDPRADVLWVGTHLQGLCRVDLKSGGYKMFRVNNRSNSRSSEMVNSLAAFDDRLYIGTLNGLYEMDLTTEEITIMRPLSPYMRTVRDMYVDRHNRLWTVGNNICRYDIGTGSVFEYKSHVAEVVGNDNVNSQAVFQDSRGTVYVGTVGFGYLVYDERGNSFTHFNAAGSGLVNDYVHCFSEIDGRLLAGTNSGLSIVDVDRGRTVNYTPANGFPIVSMMPGGILALEDGRYLISGFNGTASFYADDFLIEDVPFSIYFSRLIVHNEAVRPSDGTGILNVDIAYTDRVVLKYYQNSVSFEIGHDNYANLGEPVFQYRLSGYDNHWTDFDPASQIKYMNLPYGSYTLEVRSPGQDGEQGPYACVKLLVEPPLWATWYAYMAYFIIVTGIVLWLIYFSRSKLILKTKLEFEQKDRSRKERMNQSKLRFFANISHELKTPLTLIIGKLELLLQSPRPLAGQRDGLVDIHNTAAKMSELINELMSFQKYEHGKFKLCVSEQDVSAFLEGVYRSFASFAELKHIEFSFRCDPGFRPLVWFDPSQMHKVLNNLLGNAFKYTNEHGRVELSVESSGQGTVKISVRDSGIGIDPQHMESIFDQFYQVDNRINKEVHITGTGIGLPLSRSIVEAHGGELGVESVKGQGSTFSVSLLRGTGHFTGNEMVEIIKTDIRPVEEALPIITDDDKDFIGSIVEKREAASVNAPTILIVEDDHSLRGMLAEIFDPIMHVIEASSGDDGLDMARQHMPDIVLSDVLMPGMTGVELCARLKKDFETSHIPVVLLTALSSSDDSIRGLDCGADDYITKPFHIRLLVTKCLNILDNRKRLQEKFSRTAGFEGIIAAPGSKDGEFIEKVIRVIEANLENGRISIPLLCSEMAVSRTLLFSKMKGITGKTPHDFIQTVRLKLAARLLEQAPDMSVTDITYKLGFSSLNHFGKLFREHFGQPPSAYRKSFTQQG